MPINPPLSIDSLPSWQRANHFARRSLVACVAALLAAIMLATVAPTVPAHATTAIATPIQPLLAWDVAPDGAVYVLDAALRVYELDPVTLAPVGASARLADVIAGGGAQLNADDTRIYLRGDQMAGIQVLDRSTLATVDVVDVNARAIAVAPGQRLFYIEQRRRPEYGGLFAYSVQSVPLTDLQAEPQTWEIIAAQPFSSLFDLAVDPVQNLLFVGYNDTSGSSPRHSSTYRAYDLATGDAVDLGIEHQPTSAALRPASTQAGWAAIPYAWRGVYPEQHRIYLVAPNAPVQTIENISGPTAASPDGEWLYVVREHGLWILQGPDFALRSVIPFVDRPPTAVHIAPDGATLYLFGNGWLSALPAADLQTTGVNAFSPFPLAWQQTSGSAAGDLRTYLAADASGMELAYLPAAGEWYRMDDQRLTWRLLFALQYPDDLRIDRMSLSPNVGSDQLVVARGKWDEDQLRTTWRSEDMGLTWQSWSAPIAYVTGEPDAHHIVIASADGSDPIPLAGFTGAMETPAWSPGWTQLAFQGQVDDNWDIYTLPAHCAVAGAGTPSTCQPQRLTDSAADDLLPAWSPDGRYIAFVSQRDGNPEIYVMRADGSDQTRLTYHAGGDWRPAWLPDSRRLVFTSDRNGNNEIYLAPNPLAGAGISGREPALLQITDDPADDRDPAVDGDSQVVFLSDRDGVMQPYTADLQHLTDSALASPISAYPFLSSVKEAIGHPSWMADGRLLFAMGEGIYLAKQYAEPASFIRAAPAPAIHPAAGPTWYWPD